MKGARVNPHNGGHGGKLPPKRQQGKPNSVKKAGRGFPFRDRPGQPGAQARRFSSVEELAEATACPQPAGDGTVCSPTSCAWFQGVTQYSDRTGRALYTRCICGCPDGGAMGRVVHPKSNGPDITTTTGAGQ